MPKTANAAFQLSGGHPALDFVNTLDNRFALDGPVELLRGYADLLAFVQQSGLLSAHQTRLLDAAAKKGGAALLAHAGIVGVGEEVLGRYHTVGSGHGRGSIR